jgi:hypothetical protein
MTSATLISERKSSPLAFLFLVLVSATIVTIVVGKHAEIRHGAAAVQAVRENFLTDGRCKSGPSAVLKSDLVGSWMFICFRDSSKVDVWITTDDLSSESAREITAIPAKHIRNPKNYLLNNVLKRHYSLVRTYGDLPDWFLTIFR